MGRSFIRRNIHLSRRRILRDLQQPHRRAGGRAKAAFPGDAGGFGDVEEVSEDGLADVEVAADGGDFLTGYRGGKRFEKMGAGDAQA